VYKVYKAMYKARISRYDGRWLVYSWDGDGSNGVLYVTFKEACDKASVVTLLEMRRAGLRQLI
jgi:hypothetical protein